VERTLLARGILSADVVNTVSDSYLEEILTPEHGMSMDSVLRSRQGDLYDVLNGVDFEEFDPRTDPYIVANYDGRSFPQGKKNKAALQRSSSLAVDPDVPLFGMGPGWSRERCRRALRALEGVLQTRSRGIIGAKIVHAARASRRTMSRLIAP
jgi:glycogen synthase